MKKEKTANERMDILYEIIIALSVLLFMLILKFFDLNYTPMFFVLFVGLSNLPIVIRRKKQFKKIGELKNLLGISLEEIRAIVGAGKYDLIEWDKKKMVLSPKQLYQLEAYLEDQYLITYGKRFHEQVQREKHEEMSK